MINRILASAVLVVALASVVLSGGWRPVDAQPLASDASPEPEKVRFVETDRYVMNVAKIRYVEKLPGGGLRIHIAGQPESVLGIGENEAKPFIRRMTGKER